MEVIYCDVCGLPIKGKDFWTFYLTHNSKKEKETQDFYNDYKAYLKNLEKEIKDICPSCKKLIDEIFRLRLQNLNQLSLELLGIYELPTKDNKNEKNNRKHKK